MGIGGALGVGAAGCIFLGMIESPLLIRPYLALMTKSELFALMATGMSCIAGTMLMLYASVLGPVIPDALGHILTASVIHAPAALLVASVMLPEDRTPTLGRELPKSPAAGSVDALCRGTWEGLTLFWNIVAMDRVVAYLLEKETITGAEMVAIIEGRDPTLVEDEYASTRQETPGIEAPAKHINMISEKIEPPAHTDAASELSSETEPPAAGEATEASSESAGDQSPAAADSHEEASSGDTPEDRGHREES